MWSLSCFEAVVGLGAEVFSESLQVACDYFQFNFRHAINVVMELGTPKHYS